MTEACSLMMTKAAGCTFESTLTKKTESRSGEVVMSAVRCPCAYIFSQDTKGRIGKHIFGENMFLLGS